MIETAPRDNKFVARDYGRIVGILLRDVIFYLEKCAGTS